jgi:hypothetical protein
MTPTSHNKTLGILHLAYAGLTMLLMAVLTIFFLALGSRAGTVNNNGEPSQVGFIVFMTIVMVVISLVHAVPSFLLGYALLKRKRWAKTMGIIAAVTASMNFPVGSALCVYTVWFLFGEGGRFLYHKPAYALAPGEASWGPAVSREPVREYIPPSAPPDWR